MPYAQLCTSTQQTQAPCNTSKNEAHMLHCQQWAEEATWHGVLLPKCDAGRACGPWLLCSFRALLSLLRLLALTCILNPDSACCTCSPPTTLRKLTQPAALARPQLQLRPSLSLLRLLVPHCIRHPHSAHDTTKARFPSLVALSPILTSAMILQYGRVQSPAAQPCPACAAKDCTKDIHTAYVSALRHHA